ncbi:VWA domain-containing protein [Oceanicoccus sp. KOV_DT_Chl]|uniref:VWA domain-containing protein n=1 Tax=Oceanicoccus sp. KOV_DT_Chl TaxID=1904639 RepID=UPI000C7D8FFE|nr:VWA domain-containing protein [Oceanicoccus sp. KOV_DT_Chl]
MQKNLVNFIATLRNHDIRISTSESLDAMRVLALVGYNDRLQFKHALSATLAKTIAEKSRFDYCFELFYGGSRLELSSEATASDFVALPQDLTTDVLSDENIQAAISTPLVKALLQDDNRLIAALVAKAGAELDTEKLRYFTQTGQYTRKLLLAMNVDTLDQSIHQLQNIRTADADYVVDILTRKKIQLRDLAKQQIEEKFLLTANAEGRKLQENVILHTRLSTLENQHLNQLQEITRKISKKLAAKHSQRLRIKKRGKLDVAKTLRKNIHHDGILFNTYWKNKRKDKAKVIVLCDVSNSVAAYAKFLLLFLYSLNDILPRVRSYCFSNRSGEVTDLFDQQPAPQAIETAFKQWGQGGSDYGQSLVDFADQCLASIDNNTTVIILGDARNNKGEPRLDILQNIYQRAKTVIWLNPERRSSWYTGDSEMRRYQSACHFVSECQSLHQLTKIVDQLLKLIK